MITLTSNKTTVNVLDIVTFTVDGPRNIYFDSISLVDQNNNLLLCVGAACREFGYLPITFKAFFLYVGTFNVVCRASVGNTTYTSNVITINVLPPRASIQLSSDKTTYYTDEVASFTANVRVSSDLTDTIPVFVVLCMDDVELINYENTKTNAIIYTNRDYTFNFSFYATNATFKVRLYYRYRSAENLCAESNSITITTLPRPSPPPPPPPPPPPSIQLSVDKTRITLGELVEFSLHYSNFPYTWYDIELKDQDNNVIASSRECLATGIRRYLWKPERAGTYRVRAELRRVG